MILRNKVFLFVFCGLILLVMIAAPLNLALTNAGVVEKTNVGNVIEVEKVYEEGAFGAKLLNGIEEAKRGVREVYTNYLPFYVGVTSAAKEMTSALNRPVSGFLMDQGNRILLESRKNNESAAPDAAQETPADTTAAPVTDTAEQTAEVTEKAAETPVTEAVTEKETAAPDEPKAPEPATKAVYIEGDSRHRYYEIISEPDGKRDRIDFYVRIPAEDVDEVRPAFEEQLKNINRFAAADTGVNWYVFPVTCFEDTALCDELLPSESKRVLFEEFRTRLDPRVQFDCVEISSIEDKDEKYFRTDHHWNVYGYTEAYIKIARMMRKNYSDIEMYVPEIRRFDDVKFLGSNALAISSRKIYDTFAVALYPLPPHTVVREDNVGYGGTETLDESLRRYESGQYERSESYPHYISYQMICRQVDYPENKTGRNLLIIGDSYSPPLHEVLASYFDHTYIRYVDSNDGLSDTTYEDLIKEYGITDVLLLEMSDRVIYDYYGDSLKGIR